MPKLSPDNAASAAKEAASGGAQTLLPVGEYPLRLTEVEATTSKAGKPMWVWKFEVDEGEFKGNSIWEFTVIQENTMWKIGQIFAAFGVDTSTNTDDLHGEVIRAVIDQEVAQAGKRKDEVVNRVKQFIDKQDATASGAAPAKAQGGSTEEVPF